MSDDLIDVLGPIGIVLLIFVSVVGGLLIVVNWFGSYQCHNYAAITGKNTKWATMDVCYIETKDGWQRWDEYVKRATGSEGLKEVVK